MRRQDLLSRFVARVGNPLRWDDVPRVWMIEALAIVPMLPFCLRAVFLVNNPEVEPYFDRGALRALEYVIGAIMIRSAIIIAVGAYLRGRGSSHPLFVGVVCQSWWIAYAVIMYMHGPVTTPMWTLFPLFAFFCMLLFGVRDTAWGVATGLFILFGTALAERLGWIPYAPLFATWPEADGRIYDEWYWSSMLWPAGMSVATLMIFRYILRRSDEQSEKIQNMSEILKQMFGRYMSTEVMNTLLEDPHAFELGGERRKVTILVTDLRGFTALAEQLPPERVLALLNNYFAVMIEICLKYNGTINEIIGDALLVTFGAPQEVENHAAAAVACAIEMQNAMQEVNDSNVRAGQPTLHMGIGLNTAIVVVGNIGSEKRSKFGIVGSGVNLASRIESFSVGGQVLASQAVVDELRDSVRIDAQREVLPKGAESPMTIYEIAGIGAGYNLALEQRDDTLVPAPPDLFVRVQTLADKALTLDFCDSIVRLFSSTGIEIEPAPRLEPFDNVRIQLAQGSEKLRRAAVYGKVTGLIDASANGAAGARIRFTSVPPEVAGYLEGLRGHQVVASR